ncbi:response regulator [Patescibacteria group bacterium]|nr:response regulator [Patescibacteria group bacterium]
MSEKKPKILIIEDDPFLLSMYVTKLEANEFEVASEEDGEKGIKAIKDEQPDLLLLDILLPGKDGFEILEDMKTDEELKGIPVILLTNLGQRKDVEKGLELGAVDYLIKAHFTPSEVITKIMKVLEKSEK